MQPRGLINAFVPLFGLALYLGQAEDIAAATASFTRQRADAKIEATRASTPKHEQPLLGRLLPRRMPTILKNRRCMLADWIRMPGAHCPEVQSDERNEETGLQ